MFSDVEVINFVKGTEIFKNSEYDDQFANLMKCTLYHFKDYCPTKIDYKDEYDNLTDFHLRNGTHLSKEFDYFEVVLNNGELRLYTEEDEYKEWCWIVFIPNL